MCGSSSSVRRISRYTPIAACAVGMSCVVKTDLEIELLKEAVDITAKGFRRTLRFVKPGVAEYEVEAELAREFIKRRGVCLHPDCGSRQK